MANNGVPNPNFKGYMAFRPIGMQFKLVMVVEIQVNQWLTTNEFVFFIGVNPWTETQNNRLNQSCEKNTRHYAMNTKVPFLYKRLMFGM
jgi:hypothetical protein